MKSDYGKRPVQLPRPRHEELRALRTHQRERRLRRGPCAGVPAIRMHVLRHLHNTTQMPEGINPKIVKERRRAPQCGVQPEQYSWVTPDLQEVAVEALSRSFARTPEETTGTDTGLLPDQGPASSVARTARSAKSRV